MKNSQLETKLNYFQAKKYHLMGISNTHQMRIQNILKVAQNYGNKVDEGLVT